LHEPEKAEKSEEKNVKKKCRSFGENLPDWNGAGCRWIHLPDFREQIRLAERI
jgi:hypothetical protein